MGEKTGISWTDSTWSPLRGCSVASPGCEHCYAAGIAARFSGAGLPFEGFAKRSAKRGLPQWTGKVELRPEHLADPLRWKKGRRIFVSSMSDVFHEELSNESVAAIFGVMAAAPQHTFQVLTKRAKRMREWFEWIARQRWARARWIEEIAEAERQCGDAVGSRGAGGMVPEWAAVNAHAQEALGKRVAILNYTCQKWPLPNVHLGVSVEDQKRADERIPELLQTPAAIRFLSVEPQIEAVDLTGWGRAAPTKPSADMKDTLWSAYPWEAWVPQKSRTMIENFWSKANGRGPWSWLNDHVIQRVPRTGALLTVEKRDGSPFFTINKMAATGTAGLYVHLWNNIGQIVTEDGTVHPASGGSGSGWLSKWLDDDGEYRQKLHWVIQGGESGRRSRPFDLRWARSMRDQCAAAGVAYFLKQLGAHPTDEDVGVWSVPKDRAGADPSEWDSSLRVQQFPGGVS